MESIHIEASKNRESLIQYKLKRDSSVLIMALELAIKNSAIMFDRIESFKGYSADCEALDDIQQELQNIIEKIESLNI